ncbi:YgjP-like metallopeptidase domain-containing protein [Paenibacillus lutimineralis]|uniref:YgjP-like metallopeptidase domain-containing protein n=1 Tax=Paenibacillus lutimineralis TaxID=2707005 RepID=UPI001D05B7B4|nr:YgjP-like metallopeptidase domain-containing protein [Paenibacillus lutimineralis]
MGGPVPLSILKIAFGLCLYVKLANGNVTVSAPLSMSDEAIERFVWTKVSWIKKQTTNVLRVLNAALVRGVTVVGKRFKLEKLK